MEPPDQTPEGWVNDGKIRISIGEGKDQKGSFLLSINEVCRLIMTLNTAVKEHEAVKSRLWRE
ncbi:MAG: hypothetical protein ACFFED_06155 [Candidatus Thorarchaeota archaeon]